MRTSLGQNIAFNFKADEHVLERLIPPCFKHRFMSVINPARRNTGMAGARRRLRRRENSGTISCGDAG